MSRPGPSSPIYWPEADSVGGHWFDAIPGAAYDGWVVFNVPPEPFLKSRPGPYWPRAKYGPPATIWIFTYADLIERLIGLDPRLGRSAIRRILRKIGGDTPVNVPIFFPIPDSPTTPIGEPLRYLMSTIKGKIGTDEEVAHTFKWRTPTLDAALTTQQVQDIANIIRDKWLLFLAADVNGLPVKQSLSADLKYTEVRVAYVEQTTPNQPKPTYLVPTQYSLFEGTTGQCTGTAAALPYEVACVISLNSNFRGPRFRGRSYLGPFTIDSMGAGGNFNNRPPYWGNALWSFLVAVSTAANIEAHVVSRKYNTSAKLIGARTGIVPDSQRRRRKSRPELYVQTGGLPVGGLP